MRVNNVVVAVPVVVRLLFALLLFPVALSAQPASAQPPAPHVRSIAQARGLPIGSVVTLEGTVTTPSGAFESSFFDKGFAIQDHSAGIYVSLQTDLGLTPRQDVRVTGTLQDSYGLLILVPAAPEDVSACGGGFHVRPSRVSAAEVSEATEGLLVTVTGQLEQAPASDLPYGYKFALRDASGLVQIFINLQTGIDVGTLAAGQKVSVTGFSSQFDDHYEIDPRSPSDIVAVPH
jgi:uncharacterized protein YdeI (BOF family)